MAPESRSRTTPAANTPRGGTGSHDDEPPPSLPTRIFAQASPHSRGGVPLFDAAAVHVASQAVEAFSSPRDLVLVAASRLRAAGFEVLQVTPYTINVAGPPETYARAFGTWVGIRDVPVIKPHEGRAVGQVVVGAEERRRGLVSVAGTPFADVLEGVAFEEKRYDFTGPAPLPPPTAYWHLRLPSDLTVACNADRVHRLGVTGRGVRVAMVDSGWYAHPYFAARGYRAAPVLLGPGATASLEDASGHGTGESANVFALAPDVELLPVKMSPVNAVGAFNAAVGLKPDVITCSWGSHAPFELSASDLALSAAVAAAVARGIIVIFAAGNGQAGFPGQHPDVISVGGAFLDADGSIQASNYATGFASTIFPMRAVPDVCGLVGMQPGARYLMLPVEPGAESDVRNSVGGLFPLGDDTAADDGWAAFSGTSAAAPQLAGVVALLKQVCPLLTPELAKYILMATARDVDQGLCSPVMDVHFGIPAVVGPDLSTGTGLVDAFAAVQMAQLAQAQIVAAGRPPVRRPARPPSPPARPAPAGAPRG